MYNNSTTREYATYIRISGDINQPKYFEKIKNGRGHIWKYYDDNNNNNNILNEGTCTPSLFAVSGSAIHTTSSSRSNAYIYTMII